MKIQRPLKRLYGLAAVCLASSVLTLHAYTHDYAGPEDEPLTSVADLRFGVALYHYYQGKNLEALSELLVAEKKGGIHGHGDNPEIMEGGFYLAYGMERTASDIFTRLLQDNRPLTTRDAAWLYLARLRYLRADYDAAADALEKISVEAPDRLQEEKQVIRINSALRTGDLARAEQLFGEFHFRRSSWLPYLNFNMGAAFARAGDFTRAADYFQRLLTLQNPDESELALMDRALTGAGYAFLLNGQYAEALDAFSKVRLLSPMSSRALLGYGWSAVELGDYATALSPWRVLASRSVTDENTQEVLVALPYAYEKMGLGGRALQSFRRAEARYEEEIALLEQVVTGIQGHSLRTTLNIERSTDVNWLDYARDNQLAPQLSYLIELFSQDEFLGLVQELRDLLAIQENFRGWQEKLTLYAEMLDERDTNRDRELNYLQEKNTVEQVLQLLQARDSYALKIAEAELGTDFMTLFDPEDSARYERIQRAERNLAMLLRASHAGRPVMPAEELSELQESLRRQKGFLIWRSADHFDERLARARFLLAEANVALDAARRSYGRVKDIAEKGQDLQPYREEIVEAQVKLRAQSAVLDDAITRAEAGVRDRIMIVLMQQRARLQYYLANTRLAIARMLDGEASEIFDDNPQANGPEAASANADEPARDDRLEQQAGGGSP